MNWSLKARGIGISSALLLVAIVVAALYLGHETTKKFSEMKESWLAYTVETEHKGVLISELYGHFGYGGMIHNFKNYVLRQDGVYRKGFESSYKGVMRTLNYYGADQTNALEKEAIAQIKLVAQAYALKIPVIEHSIREGLSAEETDRLVRVDDSAAFSALTALEHNWRERRNSNLQGIVSAISEGESLVRTVSFILVVLVVAAFVLMVLMHTLVSSALAATERLKRELGERKRAQDAEKRLARAVEQSPTTIFITDVKGCIAYVNRKFVELTGYSKEEACGNTPRLLKSGHTPDDTYAEIWRSLRDGKDWSGVFQNKKKNGDLYWVATSILPLLDEEGQVINYIGIGEDVTEKKLAREQIARAQKMEAVALLAGGVAHDFNNVLMTIMGNIQLARMGLEDGDPQEEIDESLGHVEIASKRAQGLIRQLLTFARKQPTRTRSLNLNDEVEGILALLRASIPSNVRLTMTSDCKDGLIDADPTVLHQIVLNLARNAAEAFSGEAGKITIHLARVSSNEHKGKSDLRLQVCDDGPGMSEHVASKVFDPFFSTKPVGKGTGLGLAVVRNSVEDLNGTVTLNTAPGAGTVFELEFPELQNASVERPAEKAIATGRESILLVDDEEDVLSVIRRILQRLGYQVEAYSDPLLAKAAFKAAPDKYAGLFVDFMMPEMSGPELIEALRKVRPSLPVVLCSAYRAEAEARGDLENVFHLDKPVEVAELSRVLRLSLDARKTAA
ncbi:hybrid sensor histidine kinase/response regulator [Flexibacterium corallicola]|uniref:hybrid sensor histidine kinase/response regulator n=1 Tax=Flexibacterium corallicola TaxID=3037259 RepID=UPI00286F018F|nr:ATP-binding protein [Pseudovibrio sp. M1P-2-3]